MASPNLQTLQQQTIATVILLLYLVYQASANTDAVYRLQDSNGARLPNNSIIAPNTLTDERGISCCGSTLGSWFYPNGTAVGSGVPRTVLYVVKREMCSELLVEIGSQFSHITEQDEGVYMCHATDSIGSIRSLFAGIYRPVSHDSSVGPVLPSMDPITLKLLSDPAHYPPSFSLNCTSISFPPTQLSWLLNGMDVETLISESSTSQQIRNKLTTTYDNILTVTNFTPTGRMVFTCRVGNTRGSQSATLTVLAPSGPPTNVSTSTPGDSNVIVRWTPSDNTLGYRVFFVSDGATSNMTIDDPTADSTTLIDLTAGVEYTISVQAFADLPSQISETVSITLVALAAPTILSISPVSPTSITVTWSPPPSQVQAISGYRISYSPFNNECPQIESGRQLVEGGTTTEHTLTGLQEGVEYAVTVQARGVQAFGEASVSMRESTVNAVPSAPPSNVTAVPRSSPEPEIAVSWSLPPCEHVNSADGITGYVVRYRPQNNGDWTSIVVNSATRTTTIEENIVIFVMYEIQVAASNDVGMGPYSLSESASVAAIAPGIVTSLTGRPDIISITVSWDPPVNGEGRGHISKYRFCHKPVSSSFNTCVMLKGEEMQSYRIRSLQPDNPYSVTVRAFIEDLEGPIQELTQTTLAIGKVEGVRVRMVGDSSVNVTWEKLNSLDVSGYQISYSSGGSRRKRQDNTLSVGNVNSAVVSSLQSGVTYNFRVSAVVLVNNLSRAGPLSDITTERLSFSVPDAVYRLQDNNGARLPNNSIIAPGTLTDERGISCCGSTFGNWFYPNGTAVGLGMPRTVLYVVKREMCSELLVEIGSQFSHITEQDEGVYMCHATDSIGSIRSLFAGIYRPVSHDSSVGPVLPSMDPITLQILSNLTHYPPSFSLNCTSTSFPPTQLSWLLDGMDVETLISESSTSQQIRNKLTTTYDNILTVSTFTLTGRMVFTCRVGNTRGSQRANLTVLTPSGPPTNVSTSTPGDSNVIVRWTPSDNTLGYRVFFVSDGVTSNMTIDDPTADSATLTDLTAGVEYTISVQAFADLPSQISETVSITLVALAAPTILSISPVSPTSITVTWSPPPSQVQTISGYRISYSPFNNECPQIESGRQLVEGGTTTEHTLTGLQEGVEYAVTVQARGVQAFGEASVSMRESTLNAVPSAPPSNVIAVPRSSPELEIAVSWSLPPCEYVNSADGITGYVVQYRPQNNGDWTSIVVNSATRTTTIEENIVMLVMYEIQVAASNDVGMGPYSLSESASVAAIAPGIVTSLTGRPDIISITVSWDPPVNGEGRGHISKYRFCHKPVSSSFNTCVMLKGEEMQSYRIRSLQPDNPYSVTVRAFIEDLEGPIQELTQTTLAIGKVEGVRVSMVGESSVNVTWEKLNSLDVSGYQISYSSGGSRRKRQDNTLSVGDVNSAVVSSLQSGVTYNFRVSAVVLVNNLSRAGPLSDITTESSFSVPVPTWTVAVAVLGIMVLLLSAVIATLLGVIFLRQKKNTNSTAEFEIDPASSIHLKECSAYGFVRHTTDTISTNQPADDEEHEYEYIDPVDHPN